MAIIDKPTDYFDTVLYTGNGTAIGSGGQTISGLDFQPNFSWGKTRTTAQGHRLVDSVSGTSKQLHSNNTNAQTADTEGLTSFTSSGFTVGSDVGWNESGASIVAWNWKAGTAFTNDASATGIGTIDSTGSVNTDAGFSIISYTGNGGNDTVGHGLGATPKIVIIKNRDRVSGWHVGGDAIGSVNQYLNLNNTDAIASATTGFQSFSSTTFGIGTDTDWNASSESIIAYCFAEKQGYSKFGSYTGNGNVDGTFVYTGFKPAFVMIKQYDAAGTDWIILDNKRPAENPADQWIAPNEAAAEVANNTTPNSADLLSNGFKLRGSAADGTNGNSDDFIYAAFAEAPFVTSTGVPACAR